MGELEVWGGHECSLTRVGDSFRDQTELTGHHRRLDDLERFSALGLKALRYPVLWEKIAPERPEVCDWTWSDQRLDLLRRLNLRVIAGLCHHGAGPQYADLVSPGFALGLARHAEAAALRYPWIEDWTPINEPLTTARFAGLYGHWHPHRRDELSFWTALLNEVDATRFAMQAIRKHNSKARLIQTDDLGRTYSTARLQDQAEHDNLRRWMGWDLLFGRVGPHHPFWRSLCRLGFENRLRAIADAPCPPDIVGVNHYLTSDRFLDHRVSRYPGRDARGNGRTPYVDVEAVRVVRPQPAGLAGALEEAWARYHTPIAITEVHNACTRDEQVRWFAEAWDHARRLRNDGADIVAVTAWSLLGAYDWNSLMTRSVGHYEPGVFDVSAGTPRPTALAAYLKRLSEDETALAPISGQGWWRRDIRFAHPPFRTRSRAVRSPKQKSAYARRAPIMIVGATGTLGRALARACQARALTYVLTGRQQVQLEHVGSIARALATYRPSAVINASGFVRVDDAEREADVCRAINTRGAVALANACAEAGVPSVTFSSDLVFDGADDTPYAENAAPNPLNVYGASKADAEAQILAACDAALIIRTAAFFSAHDPHNFAAWVVRELAAGRPVICANDVIVSPTFTPALADATLDLLLDAETGLWHLVNQGAVSWADFACRIAEVSGLDANLVEPRSGADLNWPAKRPANSALTSQRGCLLPGLDVALSRFAEARAGLEA